MDYTIVGGAVKLASRLEHGAPPGGVLISYETHAHVKDEIYCEERGPIRVIRLSDRDLRRVPQAARAAIRAELPHVRVEVALELMSADERAQAAATHREMGDQLSDAKERQLASTGRIRAG